MQADFDKLDATVGQLANGIKQTLEFCGELFGENSPEANSTAACLEQFTSSSRRRRSSAVSDDEDFFGEDEFGSGDFEGSGDADFDEAIPCSSLSANPCEDLQVAEDKLVATTSEIQVTAEEFVEEFKRMSDADNNPIGRWCPDPSEDAADVFKNKTDADWLRINDGEFSYDIMEICDSTNGLHRRALLKIEEAAENLKPEVVEKKKSKKSKRAVKETVQEIKDLQVTPEGYEESEKAMKKALKKFDQHEEDQLKSFTASAAGKLANIRQHLNGDFSDCPEGDIEDFLKNYEEMCPNCELGQSTFEKCKAKDDCHCNFKQFDGEIEKTKALKKTADNLAAKFQPELDDLLVKEYGIKCFFKF